MESLWAEAVYDLRLTPEQFYSLTPRQFYLLREAHRKRLVHSEMLHAYTTANVINRSFAPPEEPVKVTDFMPNFRQMDIAEDPKPKVSEDEALMWQTRIANLAAEMKQGHGPLLESIEKGTWNG
jgi:hypothetical protein